MGKTVKRTPQEFLRLSREAHGDKYIYPEAYTKAYAKIKIMCPTHGIFEMYAQSHVHGAGCPDCSTKRKPNGYWTFERCKTRAERCETRMEFKEKYEGAYHRAFKQNWLDAIGGHWTTFSVPDNYWTEETAIEELGRFSTREELRLGYSSLYHTIHNHNWGHLLDEAYGPSLSNSIKHTFDAIRAKFLTCNDRGEVRDRFIQEYMSARRQGFLQKVLEGIPHAKGGYDPDKPGLVYYLRLHSGQYKIGITNRTVSKRFAGENHLFDVLATVECPNGWDAMTVEDHILAQYEDFRYDGPPILASGNTELFVEDVLLLDQ